MANNCDYEIKAWSGDRKSLERLLRIMQYKDNEWYLHRVFSADSEEIVKEGDLWSCRIFGDVAWEAGPWIEDEPDLDEKLDNGATYTNLRQICYNLDIALEIWAEELGMGFQEHFQVTNEGDVVEMESADVSRGKDDEQIGGFDNYMEWCVADDIYVEKTRKAKRKVKTAKEKK